MIAKITQQLDGFISLIITKDGNIVEASLLANIQDVGPVIKSSEDKDIEIQIYEEQTDEKTGETIVVLNQDLYKNV